MNEEFNGNLHSLGFEEIWTIVTLKLNEGAKTENIIP